MSRFGICAIFKNEARYLREWLCYHELIGFDGFVLYNNGSVDCSVAAIESLGKASKIITVPWPFRPGQNLAYQHFCKTYARHFDWVAFIDIDEFIHPIAASDIQSCVELAGTHSAILINWLNFGPGSFNERPIGLVTELYDLRLADDEPWHRHVKSLVRVSDLIDCDFPHTARLLGQACNSRGETVQNDAIQPKVCLDNLVINHYYTKSSEDWKEKVTRGLATSDDPSVQRKQEMFDYCFLHGVVRDRRIQRFLPRLRAALDDVC